MTKKYMFLLAGAVGLYLIFKPSKGESLTFDGTLNDGVRSENADTVAEAMSSADYYSNLYSRRSARGR